MKKIKIESIEFYRLRYNKNIIVGYIRFNQLFNREEFIKFIYDKNISILRNKLLNYHILKNYEELNAARSPIGNWISPSEVRDLVMVLPVYLHSEDNYKKLTKRSLFRKLKNNLIISETVHNNLYKDIIMNICPSDIELRGFIEYSLRLPDKLSSSGNPWLIMDSYGKNKIRVSPSVHNYASAWGIVREKRVERYSGETYSTQDLRIILSFLGSTIKLEYLDTAELLAQATKDEIVIKGFYEMYGRVGMTNYIEDLNDIIKRSEYTPKPIERKTKYPKIYSDYNKYSISRLITDLIEDNASILINPELIGEYKRLSPKKVDSNTAVTYQKDKWAKVTGTIGNKRRANLGICFDTNVVVNIPENTVGIEPGEKTYKTRQSICLVKDGLLNQSLIGVMISNKLAGKFKRLGIIKSELVFSGEYLIDISSLPVVTKCAIRDISSYYLSRLEVKYKLAAIANEYIQEYYPEKVTLDPKIEFLKSLGIVGDYYFPKKETDKEATRKSEMIMELVSFISGIPGEKQKRQLMYKEYQRGALPKSSVIKVFLDSIGFGKRPIEEIRKEWKTNLTKYNEELRRRKFQIIMSKTTRFNDKHFPLIESTSKTVDIFSSDHTATVSWKFLLNTIKS